jgi:uncharacterized protein YdeI (BOF family)
MKVNTMKFSFAVQRTLILAAVAGAFSAAALADRPMNVDSANTAKVGSGYVEGWFTSTDGANGLSVAPAYSFADGLQVGGLVARVSGDGAALTSTGLNLKWRITPSVASGCNLGAKFEVNRVKLSADGFGSESTTVSGITGLGTCNFTQGGSLHANLGFSKASGASSGNFWGLGYEHKFGSVTPHIDVVGGKDLDETISVGLRGDIAANFQLDGSFSRSNGVNVTTLGGKFRF